MMEMESLAITALPAGAVAQITVSMNRSATFAMWVSRVLSPPIISGLGICFAAGWIGTANAWIWALVQLGMVVLFPALYVVWLLSRGRITDIDLSRREQRTAPYLVTIAGACIACIVCAYIEAPHALVLLSIAVAAEITVLCLVTLSWKISLHAAAISSLAIVLIHFAGFAFLPIVLCIPLVAWARLRLRRHTLAQTLAGTLVGALIYLYVLHFAVMS